jgi:hypothetical protein
MYQRLAKLQYFIFTNYVIISLHFTSLPWISSNLLLSCLTFSFFPLEICTIIRNPNLQQQARNPPLLNPHQSPRKRKRSPKPMQRPRKRIPVLGVAESSPTQIRRKAQRATPVRNATIPRNPMTEAGTERMSTMKVLTEQAMTKSDITQPLF